jgi:hypothetical protein
LTRIRIESIMSKSPRGSGTLDELDGMPRHVLGSRRRSILLVLLHLVRKSTKRGLSRDPGKFWDRNPLRSVMTYVREAHQCPFVPKPCPL